MRGREVKGRERRWEAEEREREGIKARTAQKTQRKAQREELGKGSVIIERASPTASFSKLPDNWAKWSQLHSSWEMQTLCEHLNLYVLSP